MSESRSREAQEDLRRSQDRDYASVGVAMLLTLRSEVGEIPPAATTPADTALADLVDRYARALFPAGPDAAGWIGVLQAAAFRDFDHSVITARSQHGPDHR